MKSNLIRNHIITSSEFSESLKLLKDFRNIHPELNEENLESLDRLLYLFHNKNIETDIDITSNTSFTIPLGLTLSYKYLEKKKDEAASDLYTNFFLIYEFLIDTVINDNGELLKSNKIYNLTQDSIIRSALMSKYEVFVLLCYLFLNLTTTKHLFYDPKIKYDANYNRFFCFLNYFLQIKNLLKSEGGGTYLNDTHIIITRWTCIESEQNELFLNKYKVDKPLSKVELLLNDSIYELGSKGIECDFANQFIGGGVLHTGRVQEEIKFTINPELISAMFFNPQPMKINESILIVGTDCFSKYSGYSNNFKYEGNAFDLQTSQKRVVISENRNYLGESFLVAIDACYLLNFQDNYFFEYTIRDLIKSYTGFNKLDLNDENLNISLGKSFVNSYNQLKIITGKWGCGAFNGDPELKFLIQLLSCSLNDRDMIYTCYFDTIHYEKTKFIINLLLNSSKYFTIKDLITLLIEVFKCNPWKINLSFYDEITSILLNK